MSTLSLMDTTLSFSWKGIIIKNYDKFCLQLIAVVVYHKYLWGGKREFSEAPRLICASYFLPAEGRMLWAILDIQHYGIQPNKSQNPIRLLRVISHVRLRMHFGNSTKRIAPYSNWCELDGWIQTFTTPDPKIQDSTVWFKCPGRLSLVC